MSDDEIKKFNEMLMGIAKHKNRRLHPTKEPGEKIMMIPLVDVLAQIRGFTNYVKYKSSNK